MSEPSYSELLRENEQLRRRVAELEGQVAELTRRLEEAERGLKRQAAPFSRGEPKAEPKKPGRKAGADYGSRSHRPPPPAAQVDEIHEACLPAACPRCGGPIHETEIAKQYQVEIPRRPIHRQFNVHIGCCAGCGCRVQGRHPLQTSDALGAAAAQLGPDAQAAVVELNKQVGLSHGKVVRCLAVLFGIPLTRGGSAQCVLRAARRLQPLYAQLRRSVRRARRVVADETGWRIGGAKAWLHTFVARLATVYIITRDRSSGAAEGLLGADYGGALVHDGWAPYDRFARAWHQQCLRHLLNRCRQMVEAARGSAARFPRQLAARLRQALALRDRRASGRISEHGLAVARGRLARSTLRLFSRPKRNAANERLARHLRRHRSQLFTFLFRPGLDATNWRGEHALRYAVVNRKVWGGNRTRPGADAQQIVMSVWRTWGQHSLSPLDFLSHILCGHTARFPPAN